MRFPVDAVERSRTSAKLALIFALPLVLSGCLMSGGGDDGLATAGTPLALVGPEADYPVVLGEGYAVAGVSYKPEDVMNYDEVGYLATDGGGGSAISAAHHTLPLPSYVEVTSLDTGRTILVRVERRGPMDGNQLLALAPGAMAQLDAKAGTPVRVRRVNTPEEQRAMLRAGNAAPLRMDTPMSLVAVLKRKLPGSVAPSAPVSTPAATAGVRTPNPSTPTPVMVAAPARATEAVAPGRGFAVQAAAFSTAENAQKAARALGGVVTRSGDFWRVRTGPFATRSAAEASLAKVKAAGYSDARIFTNG